MGGCFAEPVEAWKGIPQAYECSENCRFLTVQDRCWLIPAFAHPGGFAGLQPGFGKQHAAAMLDYAKTAVVAAMLHDETKGVVSVDGNGRAKVDYALTASDAKALLRGIGAAADILLAAGAQEVMIPFARPLLVRSPKELSVLDSHRYRPLDPILTSVHPMGSLPMGLNPTRAVVDEQGRHHQLHGLYVADGESVSDLARRAAAAYDLRDRSPGRKRNCRRSASWVSSRPRCAECRPAPFFVALCTLPLFGCAAWHDLFQRDKPTAQIYAEALALPRPKTTDVAIVLGCPANPDGTPSLCLRCRIHATLSAYRRGEFRAAIFAGGAAHNRFIEAAVMAREAERLGMPRQAILQEGGIADDVAESAFFPSDHGRARLPDRAVLFRLAITCHARAGSPITIRFRPRCSAVKMK